MRSLSIVVASALFVGLLALACSSESGSEFDDKGSSGNGSSGSSGANSSGGFGSSGSSGTSGGEGGVGSDGGDCVSGIDMYIMFDRSGSMGEDCDIGDNVNSKWCRAITALSGYFNSAGASKHTAALQLYPLDSHSDQLCGTGNGYETPAIPTTNPPFVTLPSSKFDSLLNSTPPGNGNGTPTEAAIRGLTRFTAANRRPGRVTIGILITDGDPTRCNEDLDALAALLDAHHKATTVRTYVIGMQGASFDNLETIAAGGGTPTHPDAVGGLSDACGGRGESCHHWNVGDGDPAIFTAALAEIQQSADGCKPGGGTINPPK